MSKLLQLNVRQEVVAAAVINVIRENDGNENINRVLLSDLENSFYFHQSESSGPQFKYCFKYYCFWA